MLGIVSSSFTQGWSIPFHSFRHPWDNLLKNRRFLWIFISAGNTSVANQNIGNMIATLLFGGDIVFFVTQNSSRGKTNNFFRSCKNLITDYRLIANEDK